MTLTFLADLTGPAGDAAYYSPESYSPAAGLANNRVAIQAALDAAAASGGGYVQIPKTRQYGWSGEIVVPNGVELVGVSASALGLIALDSTACIKLGEWDGDSRPGGLRRLLVDGNGTGHVDGLIQSQSVFAMLEDVHITSGAGHNLLLDAAQNARVVGCYSTDAGDAALAIKNGSGGYNFVGSHFTSSLRDLAIFDDNGSTDNAYPYGSAHLNFWGGIFESYANGQLIADLRASSAGVKFWGTGFSVNGTVTMSDGCVVKLSNPDFPSISSFAEFIGCNFNGGDNLYDLVQVDGNQYLAFSGTNYIQKSSKPINVVSGSPRIRNFGDFEVGGSITTPYYQTTGGGSLVSLYNENRVGFNWKMPSTRTTVMSTAIDGDTGHRFHQDAYGKMNWNEGADFGISQSIQFDSTNDKLDMSSVYATGRFGRAQGSLVFAAGAVTIDAKARSVYQYILNGSGNITSMTITNAYDGALLQISIYAANALVPVWASSIQWKDDRTPEILNGCWTHVQLKYDSTSSVWLEVGDRVEGQPPASGAGTGGEPRRRPTNAQTGTTYTTTMADRGKWVSLTNAAAITLTIPPNSSVAYPVGTEIDFSAEGAGQVTITPGSGVTINSRGARLKSNGPYSVFGIRKQATNTWIAYGDLTT